MGQAISFFSDYSSNENRITNYCGLIMKMLYLESPAKFEEYVVGTFGVSDSLTVGPFFEQQVKKDKSIPDLIINQNSFAIHFEIKLSDWYYLEQIKKHIDGFDEKCSEKILILLGNIELSDVEKKLSEAINYGKEKNVTVFVMTFETLIESLIDIEVSESLLRLFEEFRDFLSRQNLLPSWKYLLDIVNCAGSMEEINEGFYICPNTGGPYSHRRAKFFGPYKDKTVSQVHEIKAVVEVPANSKDIQDISVRWNNIDYSNDTYKEKVMHYLNKCPERKKYNENTPLQFFIIGDPQSTDYKKSSAGGMFGSKRYEELNEKYDNAEQLAEFLKGKTWE